MTKINRKFLVLIGFILYTLYLIPQTVSAAAPTNGLVGYWNFDEGTGTTATDSSGQGNNGTLVNGPTWTLGKIGGEALNFDNIDDYVNAQSASSLDNLSALTVSAWAKANSFGENNQGYILDKSGSVTGGWLFHKYFLNSNVRFRVDYDGSSDLIVGSAANSLTASDWGQWVHWVVTWDGSASASGVHIYKNGAEVSSYVTQIDGVGNRVNDNVRNLLIGGNGATRTFDGSIDEVRVYNRVLSASEISDIYNATGSTSLPPPASPAPTISSFSASPTSITSGQSSTLSWSVTDVTSLSISGIGAVTGTSVSVSPTQTTIYTLTATNAQGSVTSNTNVTVTSGTPPLSGPRIFYIASNGSDSNNGTSKNTPWLHAPGMPSCSNVCASVTPIAGDRFIFRGGDTWHLGNTSASPYTGGTWTWQWSGTSESDRIYVGVDPTWYSGGSWARPKLDGDNPLSISPVASCAYQAGTNNRFLSATSIHYVTFDNFEWLGLCQSVNGSWGSTVYVIDSAATYVTYQNFYMHGWTHMPFNCAGGGLCYRMVAFIGSWGSGYSDGVRYLYLVLDGSDSDPAGAGAFFTGGYEIAYSVMNNLSQIVLNYANTFHDNLVMNWVDPGDGVAHGNVYEEYPNAALPARTNAIYNNVFAHTYKSGIRGVCFWPHPPIGGATYVFNNLWYDVECAGGNYVNIGQNNTNQGTTYFFNNTFEAPLNVALISCGVSGYAAPLTLTNNHYITDNASPYGTACTDAHATKVTELRQSHAVATSQGYTSNQTYPYSPITNGSTINSGTNQNAYCTALANAGHANAAAACQSDTGYACTYDVSNHTVTCPSRTTIARPAAGAWDIGAYEYVGAASPDTTPPSAPEGVVVN